MRDQLSGPGSAPLRPAEDPWDGFETTLAGHLRRSEAVGAMEFTAPSDASGTRGRCVVHLAPAFDGGHQNDLAPAWIGDAQPLLDRLDLGAARDQVNS